MPTLKSKVSEADLAALNYDRYHYPDPLVQKRMHVAYLSSCQDLTYQAISTIVDFHFNSVSKWVKVYEQQGIDGLKVNNYGTNKSILEGHAADILTSLKALPPRTVQEAAERIFELTGIRRSPQQVRVFIKKQGLKYRKCGHIPAKADSVAQHKWVDDKLTPAIKAAKEGEAHLLFCDAAHFVLGSCLCFLWSAVRVFLKGSAGRNRINVLGVVNAITKEVTTLINDTYINAEVMMAFLKTLRQTYNDGKPIAIVLDNARYQHCNVVKNCATTLGIDLLFLPPYSPNLNIIERLWKFTKKKILYAKYYDKPAAFHLAIRQFFENINHQYKEELKTLLTLKFQFFDTQNSLIYPL